MAYIKISPYDKAWPKQFEEEKEIIKNILKKQCLNIHHIGSTSIVGLSAKPVIDIICVIDNLSNSFILEKYGYKFKGEYNIPERYFFSLKSTKKNIHLHVVEDYHSFIPLNLSFRDYLRTHKEELNNYCDLKKSLAKVPIDEKKEGVFSNYTLGKNSFIKSVLKKTNFDDLYVNFCMHDDEWGAAHKFRKYYFDHLKIIAPFPFIENSMNHKHFILYKGPEIMGYAHIEIGGKDSFITHCLAVIKNDSIMKEFLTRKCQKWYLHNKEVFSSFRPSI